MIIKAGDEIEYFSMIKDDRNKQVSIKGIVKSYDQNKKKGYIINPGGKDIEFISEEDNVYKREVKIINDRD